MEGTALVRVLKRLAGRNLDVDGAMGVPTVQRFAREHLQVDIISVSSGGMVVGYELRGIV